MSAHIALPEIDHSRSTPATLAPTVLTGLLRDSLGFRGLAVTDALNMGGVINGSGSGAEAAVRAFLAGADLLLQPTDPGVVIDGLEDAVESGRISWERLDQSVRRVLALKQRLGLFAHRTVALDSVPYVVGSASFQAVASDVAQRSLVLVRDRQGNIDSLRHRAQDVALITYGDENSPGVGLALAGELRSAGYPASVFRLWPASGPASYDSARTTISRSGITLFAVSVRASAFRGTIAMPDSLAGLIEATAGRRRAVLVSLGSPYLLSQAPSVGSYLLAWSANRLAETAVARALTGQAPITGHLPISLPPEYPINFGLTRPSAKDAQ
jgi:beta-N-acetylhexosaminidase